MKTPAAVLVELNKPLEIMDLEVPELQRGQVLVRVLATSICGSQLGEISGVKGPDKYLPHLLGHEAGGVVEAVGSGVKHVKAGNHVVLHWKPGQGLQAETPAVYRSGSKKINAGHVTTFQERTVVSENRVTPVSEELAPELASLYGCCLTTAYGVITRDALLQRGESILIMGAGGLGLAQIVCARLGAASIIIAVDVHDEKLELAKTLGATHVIHAKKSDVRAEINKILNKTPLDIAIENTGLTSMIELCYEVSGPQARVILVGVPDIKQKASIYTLPLHFGKVLKGSHGGNALPHEDIPLLIDLFKKKRLNPSVLLGQKFTLTQINQAVDALKSGTAVRPVISF